MPQRLPSMHRGHHNAKHARGSTPSASLERARLIHCTSGLTGAAAHSLSWWRSPCYVPTINQVLFSETSFQHQGSLFGDCRCIQANAHGSLITNADPGRNLRRIWWACDSGCRARCPLPAHRFNAGVGGAIWEPASRLHRRASDHFFMPARAQTPKL